MRSEKQALACQATAAETTNKTLTQTAHGRLPEFIDPHPQLRGLNTAVVLQKGLWRMVQDYLWRQVAVIPKL